MKTARNHQEQPYPFSLLHRNAGRPTATRATICRISLGSQDHVVVVPQPHAVLCPLLKVPRCGNSPPNALLLAYRPVLLESPRPFYGRLVHAGACEDLVRSLLEGEITLGCPRFVRGEVGVSFDDVVFNEGVSGPAVDGEVAGASGIVCSAISNRSRFRKRDRVSSSVSLAAPGVVSTLTSLLLPSTPFHTQSPQGCPSQPCKSRLRRCCT